MRYQPQLRALPSWVGAFGITPDTRISTPLGERPAHDLTVGDLVYTRDAGIHPISEIREAVAAPSERNHFPVHIPQGALGDGLPRTDLHIGPQHRVLFDHFRVSLMFGEDAVLARAKSLAISHPRVVVERALAPTSYIQISLTSQAIIYAEGVPIETVLPDGECDLDYMTLRSWELRVAVA